MKLEDTIEFMNHTFQVVIVVITLLYLTCQADNNLKYMSVMKDYWNRTVFVFQIPPAVRLCVEGGEAGAAGGFRSSGGTLPAGAARVTSRGWSTASAVYICTVCKYTLGLFEASGPAHIARVCVCVNNSQTLDGERLQTLSPPYSSRSASFSRRGSGGRATRDHFTRRVAPL